MPATYLKVFLQHAASEQLDVDRLLAGAGVRYEELMQSGSSVSFLEMRQVLASVTRTLGPGWHLSLAQKLTVASHGPLGFAAVTAPDLRAAVDVLLRFIGTRGPFLWLAGTPENDRFVIRLYETTQTGEERRALVELALLTMQNLLERPLGRELSDARLSLLPTPDPATLHNLNRLFTHTWTSTPAGTNSVFPLSCWTSPVCCMTKPCIATC